MINRLSSVKKECHAVKVRLNQLKDKIATASEVDGITLDEGAHEDIKVHDPTTCIVMKSKLF